MPPLSATVGYAVLHRGIRIWAGVYLRCRMPRVNHAWRRIFHNVILFIVFYLSLMSSSVFAATPAETAEDFLRSIIRGEKFHALELIADTDRSYEVPFGRYNFLISSPPRFPSRWGIEILSTEKSDEYVVVKVSITHPEIEASLRTSWSSAIQEMALRQYLKGELPSSKTDTQMTLVQNAEGGWSVRTFAEKIAWLRARRYPVEADVAAMNRDEIEVFRDRLTERFPSRIAQIEELVGPELAVLDAAQGLRFENISFVDDRTREPRNYSEPAYEVGFTVENTTKHVIEWINAKLVFRNENDEIVETGLWILSDDDLPQGFRRGERYSTTFGQRIDNLSGLATYVEIQLAEVRLR